MARAESRSSNPNVRRAEDFMRIAPGRFELPSRVPKTRMLDHYTTGLRCTDFSRCIKPIVSEENVGFGNARCGDLPQITRFVLHAADDDCANSVGTPTSVPRRSVA